MLHEILLSLSGHPSALFDADTGSTHVTSTVTRLLSPPEVELLSSIGHLSRLHRKTRDHVTRIAASHPSTVCRAVATAIDTHQLGQFQRKILDVESRILNRDASTVGAYNIVPLAGVVSEFSEWTRLMSWLWEMSNFMLPSDAPPKTEGLTDKTASGAATIDKLRSEAQTGYPDIEDAAHYLGKIAETSWLRQLSTWLLYGKLPSFGASDFFIQQWNENIDESAFNVHNKFLPKFVTRQTASSILFIGKSLNQIRQLPSAAQQRKDSRKSSELDLLSEHVQQLAQVTAPITSAKLSEIVANIRLSLSRNLLQHLLPREKIVETLKLLHQFFLIGRGEFAMILIAEADIKMASRHRGPTATQQAQSTKGILLKEIEINQVLARSLSHLSTLSGEDDHTDDVLDIATQHLHLTTHNSSNVRPGTPGREKDDDSSLPQLAILSFDDLLFSVPTSLTMDIHSPLDLFINKADLDLYSAINSFLLAVRRAHLHLASLWRHSSIRRDHPCPPGYQYSNSARGKTILSRRRERASLRTREMRRVWATCAAAIFFLAESEAYFQGAVVQESFEHFLSWVIGPHSSIAPENCLLPLNLTSASAPNTTKPESQQHDPEAVATAHRRFLSSVAYYLLLTDTTFTKSLRLLCTHIDELVAYVTRLTKIQGSLDMEEDDGVEDYAQDYKKEEKRVKLELDRSRKRMDSDLKTLVERLREIDGERIGTSAPGLLSGAAVDEGAFEPVRVGGIDRLLMKLDWDEEEEGEEDHDDLV